MAPLAMTMGEPGGIGIEIAVKAWRVLRYETAPFFLIADADLARREANRQGIDTTPIVSAKDAAPNFADRLPVLDEPLSAPSTPGRADPASARAVIASIERAVRLTLAGEARGVVTNPIQKASLQAAGFGFPGHTEFLAMLTAGERMPGRRPRGPVMLLVGPHLRTAPVTIHLSVRDAAAALTADRIVDTALVVADALRLDFGIQNPRLAMSGLNPHAGEEGKIGREDDAIVAPAVERLRFLGIAAHGPLPADSMFHARARATYDAAICMLHDQALIPVKTIDFDEAVNVTLGLPIVRTSPDHGTALDIAGRGIARPDSLIAAVRLADAIARRRAGAS